MSRNVFVFLAKFGISAFLLVYILKDLDLQQVDARLEQMNSWVLVAAILCIGVQMVGVAIWRWDAVLRTMNKIVARAQLARLVAIGIFFNQVLPTTFGGDGLRIWLLSRGHTTLDVAVRSVVLDRALGLIALLLLSFFCSLYVGLFYENIIVYNTIHTLIFMLVVGAIMSASGYYVSKYGLVRFHKYHERFSRLSNYLSANRFRLGYLLLVSVAGHILSSFAVWLTAMAFAIDIPILATLSVVPIIFLAAALPVSISGWGVREGGMIIGLGLLGVSSGDATLVSVVTGLLTVLLGVMGGLVWVTTGFEMIKVRQSEKIGRVLLASSDRPLSARNHRDLDRGQGSLDAAAKGNRIE